MTSEHYARALEFFRSGNFASAEARCLECLQTEPKNASILHLLGMIATQAKNFDVSIGWFQQAIAVAPGHAEMFANLGIAFELKGSMREAMQAFQHAMELNPNHPENPFNVGRMYRHQGNLDSAIHFYQAALQLNPAFARAHNNLGNALIEQGHVEEAEQAYRQAIAFDPNYADAFYNLGNVWKNRFDFDQAEAAFQQAIQLRPEFADAYFNLGVVHEQRLKFESAAMAYYQAWQIEPSSSESLVALIHQRQHLCQWDSMEALTSRAFELIDRCVESNARDYPSPFCVMTLPFPTTASQQMRCARHWTMNPSFTVALRRPFDHPPNDRRLSSRLRIGYLSNDFHSHATAWLLAGLFEAHDRERFEIFGYSYGPDDGTPTRQRIVSSMEHFRDLQTKTDLASAELIRNDKIDILVDLKGYTRQARSSILAYRPASIQVNFLGYPGTMGADFIDYILVDDFIVPPSEQSHFSEKLLYLDGCYQVNDRNLQANPRTPSRAACGLPEEGFVFCAFNNSYKITPSMFACWMRLLEAIPSSVLWLLESNQMASDNLRRYAEQHDIDPQRLIFAPVMPIAEHLARHRLADIFLDCFPVNAHTTASDSLRMGLPIVTLSGETFISRVAGSLLRSVGLSELITYHLNDYEKLALELARNPDVLDRVRQKLNNHLLSSSLYDTVSFARKIEALYRQISSTVPK